jgi:hypothetical protein
MIYVVPYLALQEVPFSDYEGVDIEVVFQVFLNDPKD